jgi:hypothetical protein
MFTGWYRMVIKPKKEFISVDVKNLQDPRSYEMLSRDRENGKTPEPLARPSSMSPAMRSGRETPDYFGREARYKSPSRSFSSPKPPQGGVGGVKWDPTSTHAQPTYYAGMDPLSMNKI